MSKSAKREIRRQIVDENRHREANVPMELPDDAYEVVPGIFVAAKAALPRLIEFFNVRAIVRVHESNPGPDEWLTDLGGSEAMPYGDVIDPKNIYHAPLTDSVDETDFIPWAIKCSDFISNTLATEDDDGEANDDAAGSDGGGGDGGDDDDEHDATTSSDNRKNKQSVDKNKLLGAIAAKSYIPSAKTVDGDDDHDDDDDKSNVVTTTEQNVNGDDDEDQKEGKALIASSAAAQQQEPPAEEEQEDLWAQYRRKAPGAVAIHCEAGRSRSPAIALAYLISKRKMTLEEAMELFDGDAVDEQAEGAVVEGSNSSNQATTSGTAAATEQVTAAANHDNKAYKLQLNPIFVLGLAELESRVLGHPAFDLDAYWKRRLADLFPKIPPTVIAQQLSAAGGNMLVAREKLMTMAARQFFDRDALMIDALYKIALQTVEDHRHAPDAVMPASGTIMTKEECAQAYNECGKKRDVALMQLTKLIKQRLMVGK